MTVLDRCILFATEKHSGQVYRGFDERKDEPYILHPLRVMLRVETDEERQTAVLHDALEDTATTPEELQAVTGVSDLVLDALVTLRWLKGQESYFDYIGRVDRSKNPLVRPVKSADLYENLSRKPPRTLADRYRRALEVLEDDGA